MFFFKLIIFFKTPFFKVGMIAFVGWVFDFLIYITLLSIIESVYVSNLCGNIFGICFTFIFGIKLGFNNKLNFEFRYMLLYFIITILIANSLALILDFVVNSHILGPITGKILLIIPSYLFNYFNLKCINNYIIKNTMKAPYERNK